MTESKQYNVLFLCTGNSARSIMAEAILERKGRGNFHAYSAGSHPTGTVQPQALKRIEGAGLSAEGFRSKSWDEFTGPDAPHLDFVFTVCDNAAQEGVTTPNVENSTLSPFFVKGRIATNEGESEECCGGYPTTQRGGLR